MKRFLLFIIGLACLIAGITLILSWWPFVIGLFKGATGVILAVAGLFMIYSLKIK